MKETNSPDASEPLPTCVGFSPEQLAIVVSIAREAAREEIRSSFFAPADVGIPAKETRALRRTRKPK